MTPQLSMKRGRQSRNPVSTGLGEGQNHPATAKIELHHALLGTVGVCAALSKAVASSMPSASQQLVKWAEVAWAGSVILFGLLLLVYSE